MVKFIRVGLFVVLLSLTSCFDVIDEISLNNDGSGDFKLIINMSKSKTRIASVMLLDSLNGVKIPSESEVKMRIDEWVVYLKNSQGISNVKQTSDFNEYIFTLSFQFHSVEDINRLISNISFKNGKRPDAFNLRYSYDPKTRVFSRYFVPNATDRVNFEKMEKDDQTLFSEGVYTSISRFQQEVNECSNKNAKISKSGNAVMLRTNLADIVKGNLTLNNSIQLK